MKRYIPFLASFILLISFTTYFVINQNYEFLTYAVSISIVIYFLYRSDKTFKYSNLAKWGFMTWLLLHLLGGSIHIINTRLYDLILFYLVGEPLNILRYDQFVHGFCYFVITLFVYPIVASINGGKKTSKLKVGIITVLAATGVGAFNEILEFMTVIFFNAGAAVGNYFNNALDLVFNFIGAVIAVMILSIKK